MLRSRTYKLILLAGTATALQGCVAAIVPIAASSLVSGSNIIRGSDDEPIVAAPAVDPTVIVEPPASSPALAANTTAPAETPGLVTPTLTDPEPQPAPEPEPAPLISRPVSPTPEAIGMQEPTEVFPTADEVPAMSMRDAEPIAEPVTAPVEMPAAEPAVAAQNSFTADPVVDTPTSAATPRLISVDPQVALSENSIDASSVSAAAAAAALANAAPVEEEAPVVSLARVRPEPAPEPALAPSAGATAVAAVGAVETAPEMIPPPRPAPAPAPARATPRPLATGEFAALINYANQQQARPASARSSALLADRGALTPDRAPCVGTEPTVLIDLDPKGDVFDPTNAFRAAPGLASALAQLRLAGVRIAWISGNPLLQTNAIREALNRSGLDLANTDDLLLMRYPEDRKQSRREDFATLNCVIAIAGEDRSDFDELFEYLRNPEAASALNSIIGAGWFLIPPPLANERPTP